MAGKSSSPGSVLIWVFLVLGCERSGTTSSAPPGPVNSSAQAPAAATSADAPPLLAAPLPDGCYNGLEAEHGLAQLAELAELCAPGMKPVLKTPRAIALGDDEAAFAFDATNPEKCLRALATTDRNVGDLEMRLLDADGRALATERLDAPFALLGPVCLDQRRRLKISLRAGGQRQRAYVQIYQAE